MRLDRGAVYCRLFFLRLRHHHLRRRSFKARLLSVRVLSLIEEVVVVSESPWV